MFFKEGNVLSFNLKLCNEILIPVSNKILRFSFFSMLLSMLGNKSAGKYHSFYFWMHCVDFFSPNLLNVKLVGGLEFLFEIMFFKEGNVLSFNLKLCNEILIPVSNKILRFSFFSHFIINVGEQISVLSIILSTL